MKRSLFGGKSTRTKILTLITVIAIVLLFLLSLLLKYAFAEGQVFIDLTPEGFYTLSENMKLACSEIFEQEDADGNKKEIKIIFCNDPDRLAASSVTRMTYFMALQLRNMFDNVAVETVNVNINPAAVSAYRTTSRRDITTRDMIVTYNGRYKVTDVSTFWTENAFSYNGEYRMVSIIASLTAMNSPVAYFLTDHGETYYDPDDPESEMSLSMSALAELIEERGLKIRTLNLSGADKIPEDCALLIINDPTTDFTTDESRYDRFDYISDTEKIDRYLKSHSGALIVNKAYDSDPMPVLESFLSEWGIQFGNELVKDEQEGHYLPGVGDPGTALIGVYDPDSIGGVYYEAYAELASAPKMIFTNSGYIRSTFLDKTVSESGGYNTQMSYSSFIGTESTAVAYDKYGYTTEDRGSSKDLAAMTTRTYLDGTTDETVYSYVFCTNSADFFSNDVLGNRSYANYNIMATVISSISRVDRYASMSLGGMSMNSPSYGGKQTVSTTLSESAQNVYSPDASEIIHVNRAFTTTEKVLFSIIVAIVPATLLVLGTVIFVKRKNR